MAAAPIQKGVGLTLRDHSSPEDTKEIALRVELSLTPFDVMECAEKCGILDGTGGGLESGRLLKQSESLPVPD